MEKYCISVDWLQVYCRGNYLSEGARESKRITFGSGQNEVVVPPISFVIKLLGYSTPLFSNVFEASLNGMAVAVITSSPKSQMIPIDSVIIKLENRILYSGQYLSILYALIDALNLEYISVTRLDLCYDCNLLKGGRNVSDFLYQYMTAKPMEVGHIVRKGSTRFTASCAKKWHEGTKVTSMRWGSPKVTPSGYCYNKTLEMLEVKDKPWIREAWRQCGLISFTKDKELSKLTDKDREHEVNMFSLKDYIVTPVWRFEISIKSDGNKLLDMSTGELLRLSPDNLACQERMEELFYIYASKVFVFKENTGQKNTRFYHDMELFEKCDKTQIKPIKLNKHIGTGRSERMCYNKLVSMSKEYTEMAEQRVWGLKEAMSFILETAGLKNETVRLKEHESYLNTLHGEKFAMKNLDELLDQVERVNNLKNDLRREDLEGLIYP